MDVWFDSGSSHQGVLKERDDLVHPADLYFEGSDQYRGWFNSSLTTSVAINGIAPYKGVLSHGFVMDGEGKKMSKSLGNIVVPNDVMKQLGADILRLWVASVDYQADSRVSDPILKQVAETYRKIRNTFRFLLGNLHDFDPETNAVKHEDLQGVHKFMMVKLNELTNRIHEDYKSYQFLNVYNNFRNFCTVELSSFYMDISKDTLYIEHADHPERREFQTVMYEVLLSLTKLIAPILPHTADEVWENLPGQSEESVQLTDMPTAIEQGDFDGLKAHWNAFMSVRDEVLKALEVARNEKVIGKSLQSSLTLYPDEQTRELLEGTENLSKLFIVSNVRIASAIEEVPSEAQVFEEIAVLVEKAEGETCDRCWQVSETVGEQEDHPSLCSNCAETVSNHYADVE
ncbi:class I tRNA ligase family protein [Bacillus sp. JCM 19041]|uniref:class I tRNA ligase family protein n=1 Tax=Bacillus sp. JCM 19041 TaxID=1460637 RepID=UPI000ADC41B7